jgi:tetratricopeptide (TPR) repeat protein
VTLDLPWVWAGSSQVRKGNGYARQGRWDLAEREWQDAAENYPSNTAAWHNLSLAAVAREDFELAKARIKHANSFLPGDPTYKTQLWIEHSIFSEPTNCLLHLRAGNFQRQHSTNSEAIARPFRSIFDQTLNSEIDLPGSTSNGANGLLPPLP